MRVIKASQAGEETRLGPEELEQINRLARRELTAEEVYAFSVRLCDNEVDRDGERFEPETLEELAGLFVGKCGIFDHQMCIRDREEEGPDLAAAIVEDVGAPVGVGPLAGVGVFVGGGAVELVETEGVTGEVGGDPVHDDADARLVKLVDEVFQVIGDAEAAGGGEVAGALVAPGGVQGVLGDGAVSYTHLDVYKRQSPMTA